MENINTNLSAKIFSSTLLKEDSDCSATIQGYPNIDNINASSRSCENARSKSFATPDYCDTSKIQLIYEVAFATLIFSNILHTKLIL